MSSIYGQTLLDDMVQRQGLPMPLVKQAAQEILAVIREGLISDGVVNVSNFGTFRLKLAAARQGFNPQTRERIIIPAHQRVIFSPCKALRELIQPVHHPVIPIKAEGAPQRVAARTAPIAEATAVATRTIVPPAPVAEEKPEVEEAQSTVESRLESITQPQKQPEPVEQQELAAEQMDELHNTAEIELHTGEEESKKNGHGKYFYLGAAAIVIAAVSLSIYFGSSTDELPAPSAPVARIEQTTAPVVVEPITAAPSTISEPESQGEEIDYSTLYTEMANATPEVEPPAQPVEQAVATEASVAQKMEEVAVQPLKAELPAATPAARPATFSFTEKQHTIASGESLWRLARRHYSDPLLWPLIYQANAAIISNPDSLRAGREIVIPSLQGSTDKLTKTDRRNIAEGYYLTYLHYKKVGHKDAFFALLEAKRYDHQVVEEHRSELQLNKVEEIMLSQQETMPFYSDLVRL